MRGWIDLHCHWLAGVDDGARTPREGFEMLTELGKLGFREVVATPHMRPGTFDNTPSDLQRAFESMVSELTPALENAGDRTLDDTALPSTGPGQAADAGVAAELPQLSLSSEHYFDEIVVQRIFEGRALPYPGEKAILLEFYDVALSPGVEQQLFDIQRRGLTPVIAHPERYRSVWAAPERLERLVELGSVALLDTSALIGKYGEQTRRCALALLERNLYAAACSDAHRPADVAEFEKAITFLDRQYGREELDQLFGRGPRDILGGTLPR